MSASNIFANNSPVAGKFSSAWVKGGIAAAASVGVFAAYFFLSGQASEFWHHASAPGQPSAEVNKAVTPFAAMPPAPANVPSPVRAQATGPQLPSMTPRPIQAVAGNPSAASPITSYQSTARAGVPTHDPGPAGGADPDHAKTALEESLTPTKFTASGVTEIPDIDYVIEQGRHLPCTDMTVINTTYAGSVTAIIPREIRGETGDVRLIGPGAKVFGTIEHGLANGAEVAFVAWQNITTPIARDSNGVPHQFRVTVDSPASSDLGETGLDGELNRHLLQKIGGVVGVSVLQGLTQGLGTALQHQGSNSNNNSPTLNFSQVENGSQSGAQLLLQQWIQIPDVLRRLQGKSCEIALVRDLNLKAAYPKLRSLLAMQGTR